MICNQSITLFNMGITDSKLGPPSDAVIALQKQYESLSYEDRFNFRMTLERNDLDYQNMIYLKLKNSNNKNIDISFVEWLMLSKEGMNELYILDEINKWKQLSQHIKCIIFNANEACVCLSDNGDNFEPQNKYTLETLETLDALMMSKLICAKVEYEGNAYCLTEFLKHLGPFEKEKFSISMDTNIVPFEQWLQEERYEEYEESLSASDESDEEFDQLKKETELMGYDLAKISRPDLPLRKPPT